MVRMLNQNLSPACLVSELPLKLARKCIDVLGVSAFDEEIGTYTVSTGSEEEIAAICAGKEFGLLRTVTGKVDIWIYMEYLHASLSRCQIFTCETIQF